MILFSCLCHINTDICVKSVIQSPSIEKMTAQVEIIEPTRVIGQFCSSVKRIWRGYLRTDPVAQTPFVEGVSIPTEVHAIGKFWYYALEMILTKCFKLDESPSVKDVVTCPRRIEAEVVGPIPSISRCYSFQKERDAHTHLVIQSPSIEDINVTSAGTISTEPETKLVKSTPAIGQ